MPVLKSIAPETAALHEALYLRLASLARQAEASAARRPEGAVGDTTRRLAEAVLFDTRRFIGPRGALPVAAPDLAGLATQLGQALAALETFEAQHAAWDDTLKCFTWSVRGHAKLPVARLRPKAAVGQTPQQAARMAELRQKLARRMDGHAASRYDAGYEAGRRDALAAAAADEAPR